ncbi:transcriptional regulator [Jeotgalibacillus soli]|uniref:HTH cro/C1-type domain-containing protein n=1 Tax=Jeotgalibacillus soli TaxID=889306 RepID=A0A0C2VMR2_9BACL|nr:transcriptional regulator [Jeotgalibacillus soli]KIL45731.1 hypothetical protein KP78_20800 [Jeotgalibacillus soli]
MSIYSEMLSKSVEESGLKLDKIADLIENQIGSKPSKEYLSRLKNGKTSPASNKINDALARILGIDPWDLKTAAYREKVPHEVIKRFQKTS